MELVNTNARALGCIFYYQEKSDLTQDYSQEVIKLFFSDAREYVEKKGEKNNESC